MASKDRLKELRHLQDVAHKVIDGVASGEVHPQTGAVINETIQLLLDLIETEDKLERRALNVKRVR